MRTTRREFLAGGAAGIATLALGPAGLLAETAPRTTFLLVVNLIGGNDGLNTCAPTHLSPYYERRPTLALADTLPVGGGWGLHPALEGLRGCWLDGDLQIVQRVGYPEANLSHFASRDIFATGVRGATGDGRGWLGRFADHFTSGPFGVVGVNVGRQPDFAASGPGALFVNSVPAFQIEHDPDFIPDHVLRVEHNRALLDHETGGLAATLRAAHDLVDRVHAETAGWTDPGYPGTAIARRLATVDRLESGGFGTRVYYTALGGFDTHANQPKRHGKLLAELDAALAMFKAQMIRRGRWQDCAVLLCSEFGRRNFENGSEGTDHGHGNVFLLAGGAVRGGRTGELTEADLLVDQPSMSHDFRELYSHVLERHLDVDPAPVFPEPFPVTGDLSLF